MPNSSIATVENCGFYASALGALFATSGARSLATRTWRRYSPGHPRTPSYEAGKFRLKHAEELLALFEEARGLPARTTDELARWLDSVDDDLADDIAREVAEEAGRKAGREAAKKNGREAYEEASDRAYERAYERVLESLKKARRQDHT
jgi:hypothetical protein